MYTVGMRVKCIDMKDPQPVEHGTLGTVVHIDDMGTLHVAWDNGRSLGLIVGEDKFEVIEINKGA